MNCDGIISNLLQNHTANTISRYMCHSYSGVDYQKSGVWLFCDINPFLQDKVPSHNIFFSCGGLVLLSIPGPAENTCLKTVPPLSSLCSDSEWGNWLEWLSRVGDWQVAVAMMSEVESCRDEASEATAVCRGYWARIFQACIHVHALCVFMHACTLQTLQFMCKAVYLQL